MNPASRPDNPASACLSCSRECRWPGRGHEQPSSTRATSPRALNPSFAPPHLPQPAPGDPYPWPTPEHTPAPCSQLSRHSATSELATSELSALSTRAVYGCPQARPAICRELPCCISFLPSRVRASTSRSGWRRPVSNSPGPSLSRGGQRAPFLQQMVTEHLLCAPSCSSAQALPGLSTYYAPRVAPAPRLSRGGGVPTESSRCLPRPLGGRARHFTSAFWFVRRRANRGCEVLVSEESSSTGGQSESASLLRRLEPGGNTR